jgi:hypothetical protein
MRNLPYHKRAKLIRLRYGSSCNVCFRYGAECDSFVQQNIWSPSRGFRSGIKVLHEVTPRGLSVTETEVEHPDELMGILFPRSSH